MMFWGRMGPWLVLAMSLLGGIAHAQTSNDLSQPIEDEVRQRLRVNSDIKPLGENPFGESVNLYNGTLSFEQTDIDLEGTGPAVKLTRSFSVRDTSAPYWHEFNDWKLEVPHIETIVTPNETAFFINQTARCSQIAAPVGVVQASESGGPAIDLDPQGWWYGIHMFIPGAGSQDLILPQAQNTMPLPQVTLSSGQVVKASLVTRNNWAIACLPSTSNGQPGEGFLAVGPDGTKYWLDWLVYKRANNYGPAVNGTASNFIVRNVAMMMVSHVQDRFGNSVAYTYDGYGNVTAISASDGRAITLTYQNYTLPTSLSLLNPDPGYRVTSAQVTAANGTTRTWTYSYDPTTDVLTNVTLPNGSAWSFSLLSLGAAAGTDPFDIRMVDYVQPTVCTYALQPQNAVTSVGTITHPSGLVGTFTTTSTIRGQSYVPYTCVYSRSGNYLAIENVTAFSALTQKSFSGAGLTTAETWNYSYSSPNQSWNTDSCATNNTCVSSVYTDVVDPAGHDIRYTYSNRFDSTESQLLDTTYYQGAAGTSVTRDVKTSYATYNAGPWPTSLGFSFGNANNGLLTTTLAPLNLRQTLQDGDTYTWQAVAFDAYTKVTDAKRYNSISYQPSIEERSSYLYDTNLWVLGLAQSLVNVSTGETVFSNTYNSNDELISRSRFGQVLMSYGYDNAGQLISFTDGNNHATTLGNYYRGVPQTVDYPDNTSESLVVDDFGEITSITDQLGNTQSYVYDPVGRVTQVNYPVGDTVTWAPQIYAYDFVTTAERGIAANHWRRTATKGGALTITYFDSLLRPVLADSYISGNGNSHNNVRTDFDWQNQVIFSSYPVGGTPDLSAITAGMHTTYDALERVIESSQDSELGSLATTTSYSYGTRKLVTDPKGNLTTYAYQALDKPDYSDVIQVAAPQGVTQNISRDLYGNTTSIAQSGTYSGQNVSLTKYFAYDSYHRLCRYYDPESNSTVYSYDGANNIAWLATGVGISGDGTVCGQNQVPTTSEYVRTYDAMNRMLTDTFQATGSQSTDFTYDKVGHLTGTLSGIVLQGFSYNKLGLLTGESQWIPGDNNYTTSVGYGYDANGHLSNTVYPDGSVFSYAPDAFGRPTTVQSAGTSYASNVGYFPNGEVAGFTFGNGITFSTTQNARLLPATYTYVNNSGNQLNESYVYDQNGNLTNINDLVNGANTQTLGYDGLNRLTSASASNSWGTESYTYDPLNNMRSHVAAGSTFITNFDATNRPSSLYVGATAFGTYLYDARGNQTQASIAFSPVANYTFDARNQLLQDVGVASYAYDASGRRVKKVLANGQTTYFFYNQAGQLLYAYNTATSQATDYLYLGGKSIARYQPGQSPIYVLTDRLGSTAREANSSGAITQSFSYRPFGALYSGTNQQQPGYTGHINDPENGFNYMQARYQNPGMGAFLSVDPNMPSPGDLFGFNRYAYVNNNPIMRTDPTGKVGEATAAGCAISAEFGCVPGAAVGFVIDVAVLAFETYAVHEGIKAVMAADGSHTSDEAAGVIADGKSPAAGVSGKKGELEGAPGGQQADWEKIKGEEKTAPNGTKIKILADGGVADMHDSTKSTDYPQGTPTIKITDSKGDIIKTVRYPKPATNSATGAFAPSIIDRTIGEPGMHGEKAIMAPEREVDANSNEDVGDISIDG